MSHQVLTKKLVSKTLSELEIKGNFLDLMNFIYQKTTERSITFSGEILEAFL